MGSIQYHKGMEALVATVQELSLARDIDTVTKIVRKAARDITGADGATFVLLEGDNCYYADEDAISPLWKGQRFPASACISGWAMKNKQVVVIPDIYLDPRIPVEAYRPTFVKSLVMVPIRAAEPIGAIGNYWSTHYTCTEDEIKLLQVLANMTSVSMENIAVHNDLETRVKERTARLQEMNEELEAFSYSASHDLRTPLRVIYGYVHILRQTYGDAMDEEGRKMMADVLANVKAMEKLIDDLLGFSRMSRKDLLRVEVNMKMTVEDVYAGYMRITPHRNIELKLDNLPTAIADPALIRQVWVNLISNAIKYTKLKPKAKIEVGYEETGEEIIYHVKDNGAGFDMAYYKKLFGVFHRLHSNKEFKGTGIGLAIVQRIVNRHGGKVWAQAKVEEGATFYFSIPKAPVLLPEQD